MFALYRPKVEGRFRAHADVFTDDEVMPASIHVAAARFDERVDVIGQLRSVETVVPLYLFFA